MVLSWSVAGPQVLESVSFTAATAPTAIRVVMLVEEDAALTLDDDLIAEVSRDGGTTWTAAPLTFFDNFSATKKIFVGQADVSAQPSGTAVRYRITAEASKGPVLHEVNVQWRARNIRQQPKGE